MDDDDLDFSGLFDQYFGTSTPKAKKPRSDGPEVVDEPWSEAELAVIDSAVIFVALHLMSGTLLKSGYPKPIIEQLKKRLKVLIKRYTPT